MRFSGSLRVVALLGAMNLVSAACAGSLWGQAKRTPPARRDTLTADERAAVRETTRDAR